MKVGNDLMLRAARVGRIRRLFVAENGSLHTAEINDCLLVPEIVCNLLSGEPLRRGLFYKNDTSVFHIRRGNW